MGLKNILAILFIIISYYSVSAQLSVGFAIGGLGYHPINDKNSRFYKWKLDKRGKFVGYSSISFVAVYRLNKYLGIKLNHAYIFHDCAGKRAGVTHFGVNLYDDIVGWENKIHEFSISLGPLWYYRRDWIKEPGYVNNPEFITLSKDRTWERKFVWYGGTIDYHYRIKKSNFISINVLPGYPFLYTAVFGLSHDFNQ